MPVKFVRGDMFATPGLTAFAHGCNCRGVMGAGIAAEFSRRWPKMYEEYRRRCRTGEFSLGNVMPYQKEGIWIFNLGTQFEPGPAADRVAIETAVTGMCKVAGQFNIREIAMPLVGSGIGGLDPAWVQATLQRIGNSHPNLTLVVFVTYVSGHPAQEV